MLSLCLGNRPLLSSLLRQSYLVIPRHQMFNLWLAYASFSDSSNRSAKLNLYPDYELKMSCALVANQTINKHMKQSLSLSQDSVVWMGDIDTFLYRWTTTDKGSCPPQQGIQSIHGSRTFPSISYPRMWKATWENVHGNQLSWLLKKWVALVNAPNTTGV